MFLLYFPHGVFSKQVCYVDEKSNQEFILPYLEISGKRHEGRIIIFDKDGTLLDFKETWLRIFREVINSILNKTNNNINLPKKLQNALGIDLDKWHIDGNGPLAMGTSFEVNTLMSGCIYSEGLKWNDAVEIVLKTVDEVLTGKARTENLVPTKGSIELLKLAKQRGFMTALATNDDTDHAKEDMEAIGAAPYLDIIIGADSVANTKPAPDMIFHICGKLGVKPEDSIMIGDTLMDAIMGLNAGVKLNIAIAEIVSAEELLTKADIVIKSLEEIC